MKELIKGHEAYLSLFLFVCPPFRWNVVRMEKLPGVPVLVASNLASDESLIPSPITYYIASGHGKYVIYIFFL